MTVAEMKRLLLLKFEGLFEFSAPAYSDQQLSDVLNNAQRRIVRDVDSPNPQRGYGGFDYNERVRKYLAPLLVKDNVAGGLTLGAVGTGVFTYGYPITLPSDCWYIKQEIPTLTGITANVTVKPQPLDFYSANINNPYKQPDTGTIWRFDTGANTIEVVTDGTILTEYQIVYMKEVPDVDITTPTECILHEDLHDDIVDEAYKIITGAANPETYNIANNEANNN